MAVKPNNALDSIKPYIKDNLSKGYSRESLKKALTGIGWKEEDIAPLIKEVADSLPKVHPGKKAVKKISQQQKSETSQPSKSQSGSGQAQPEPITAQVSKDVKQESPSDQASILKGQETISKPEKGDAAGPISSYIKKNLSKGYSRKSIEKALLKTGWKESQIKGLIESVESSIKAEPEKNVVPVSDDSSFSKGHLPDREEKPQSIKGPSDKSSAQEIPDALPKPAKKEYPASKPFQPANARKHSSHPLLLRIPADLMFILGIGILIYSYLQSDWLLLAVGFLLVFISIPMHKKARQAKYQLDLQSGIDDDEKEKASLAKQQDSIKNELNSLQKKAEKTHEEMKREKRLLAQLKRNKRREQYLMMKEIKSKNRQERMRRRIEESKKKKLDMVKKRLEDLEKEKNSIAQEKQQLHSKQMMGSIMEMKRELENYSGEFDTDLDKVISLVNKYENIRLGDIADIFELPKKKVEEWAEVLERHGMIKLHYPALGTPIIRKVKKDETGK